MEKREKAETNPGFEKHHSDWTTGQRVADDELGDDVQSNLLVGNSLDHPDGNDVEECYHQCEDEVLPRITSGFTYLAGASERTQGKGYPKLQ